MMLFERIFALIGASYKYFGIIWTVDIFMVRCRVFMVGSRPHGLGRPAGQLAGPLGLGRPPARPASRPAGRPPAGQVGPTGRLMPARRPAADRPRASSLASRRAVAGVRCGSPPPPPHPVTCCSKKVASDPTKSRSLGQAGVAQGCAGFENHDLTIKLHSTFLLPTLLIFC